MPKLKGVDNPRWRGGKKEAQKRYKASHRERKASDDRKYYIGHKENLLPIMKRYKEEHKEEIRAYYKEYMKDPEHRERAKARSRKCYLKHRAERMRKQREVTQILKKDILTHYGGGKCACVICGESRLACLSIDHINGGGKAHCRDIKTEGRYRAGRGLYLWLKKNNYPKGYQTLCMNDQWIKRMEENEVRKRPH